MQSFSSWKIEEFSSLFVVVFELKSIMNSFSDLFISFLVLFICTLIENYDDIQKNFLIKKS